MRASEVPNGIDGADIKVFLSRIYSNASNMPKRLAISIALNTDLRMWPSKENRKFAFFFFTFS